MKKLLLGIMILGAFAGCGSKEEPKQEVAAKAPMTLEEIITAAKAEGEVNSVGMPDAWANWAGTWKDINTKYGLKHVDTDMSSAEEIAKFKAEKENATADIGDIGYEFGTVAVAQGVTQPYKPTTWEEIPEWAKDKDGHWVIGYTGTIAFIVNKELVKDIPTSWKELGESNAKVTVGAVGIASQATNSVLAAAFALGGDEGNIQPAIDYFGKMAEQGRLLLNDPMIANLEKGEVEVGLVWDFNGLNYRDQIDREKFEVLIPSDGSLTSGYATIINKYAKHPNAAKLTREFILSDEGQINLAEGYAKPIRTGVVLPEDVKAKLLPNEQYKNARPVKDFEAWKKTSENISQLWQEEVIYKVNK